MQHLIYLALLNESQNGSHADDKCECFYNEADAIKQLEEWFHFYCDRYNVKELGVYDEKYDTSFHIEDDKDYTYEVTASITPKFIK